MSDVKKNYAARVEAETDWKQEFIRLRDINKDLLRACNIALPGLRRLERETQFSGVRADAQMAANTVEEAIRKAR